jgi:hypothetical protein
VRKAYVKASKSAQQWVESDEEENYARALELAERRHRLKCVKLSEGTKWGDQTVALFF